MFLLKDVEWEIVRSDLLFRILLRYSGSCPAYEIFFTNFDLFNLKIQRSIMFKSKLIFKKCFPGNLLEPDLATRKIAILFLILFFINKFWNDYLH